MTHRLLFLSMALLLGTLNAMTQGIIIDENNLSKKMLAPDAEQIEQLIHKSGLRSQTAATLTDLGNNMYLLDGTTDPSSSLLEMKVSATQWAKLTSGNDYYGELQNLSKLVYTKFNDDFDYIFFVLDIPQDNTIINQVGFYGVNCSVSNDVQGIGISTYNNGSYWGANSKLKSVMYLPYYSAILNGPALHELCHNWAVFICPTYAPDNTEYYAHWGVANAGGQLGGFKYIRTVQENCDGIQDKTLYQASFRSNTNADGSFQYGFGTAANGGNGLPYSDIELYLMGMKSAQELRNNNFTLDIYNGNSYNDSGDYSVNNGYFYSTTKTTYTIDDIITLKGARIPDAASSQKQFKLLTVSITPESAATTYYDQIISNVGWMAGPFNDQTYSWLYNFRQATNNVGSLVMDNIQASLKSTSQLSNDATLASLTVSAGTLSPAFAPNTTNYSVNVANNMSSLTISATANHLAAAINGAGTKALNVGANNFSIVVTAEDGTEKTYTVIVNREQANIIAVTDVSLNQTTLSLEMGATVQLIATIKPSNASNQNVSWSSSNTTIATVNSSGLVTAAAAGTATITVSTEDGNKTATCEVSVSMFEQKKWNIGYPNKEDVTATLSNGTLTISGTGKMIHDHRGTSSDYFHAPWEPYIDQIKIGIIEEGITNIGRFTFMNCSNLTSVSIPSTVTVIDWMAFYQCNNLLSLTIPNGVQTIYAEAFYGCNSLTFVNIPGSVTTIGYAAFSSCKNLTYITVDELNNYYLSEGGILFDKNKTTLIQYPTGKQGNSYVVPEGVTNIPSGAFTDCIQLTSITLPNSVTTISTGVYDKGAFANCKGLTSIVIPSNVQTIGNFAFSFCMGLTTITIPESVTGLGYRAFGYCSGLKSIKDLNATPQINIENPNGGSHPIFEGVNRETCILYVPNGSVELYKNSVYDWKDFSKIVELTVSPCENTIASGTFGENDALTWTLCPDGTLTISGNGAMPNSLYTPPNNSAPWANYVDDIKNIVIEPGITHIGNCSFIFCDIYSVHIPNSVTSIGDFAFAYSEHNHTGHLTSVTLPDNLVSIGDCAFDGTALTSIDIPASVISIGNRSFAQCWNLENIKVDMSNVRYSSYQGGLYNKEQDTLFQYSVGKTGDCMLSTNLKTIKTLAFQGTKHSNIILPENVETIEYGAFYASSLKNISIGSRVTSIDIHSFGYFARDTIGIFTNYSMIPQVIDSEVFFETDLNNNILYVPNGTKVLYETAPVWKDFGTIIELAPNTIAVTGISLSVKTLELKVDSTAQLTAAISPEDATNQIYTWGTSNAAIVTVSETGLVKAIAAGSAYVFAIIIDGENVFADSCLVTVTANPVSVTGVSLSQTSLSLKIDAAEQLIATVLPDSATNKNVTWSSSNETVATVSTTGLVTAKAEGTATITVTTEDGGFTASCAVTVTRPLSNDATLSNLTISAGTLTPGFNPNTTNYSVSVENSVSSITITATANHAAATVSGTGTKTLNTGTNSFDITVAAEDGTTKIYTVTVNRAQVIPVPVTGVSLNHTNLTLKADSTAQLTATVAPGNADNKAVTWASSDNSVATVSNGLITGISEGSATITVTTGDGGFTASCTITVEKNQTVVIEENEPAGANGTGKFDLSLTIPANTLFTGSFTLTLPNGFQLDVQATKLSGELSSSLTLSLTQNADGSWLFTISGNTLRKSTESVFQKIVDIVYTINESLKDGKYEVVVSDLSFTFEDDTHISEPKIVANVTVDHSYTGIQSSNLAAPVVQIRNNYLYVNTAVEEYIQIYSVTGQLLYSRNKPAGEIIVALPFVKGQVLVIKGSSGWVKKVM